jgi:hypothetical protein
MPSGHSALQVGVTDVGKVRVLTLVGALNATTYGPIRDTIVKAALDEPDSVVIDVTGLSVREDPAWAVFTSARWQIAEWPNVPLAMVCAHSQGRNGAQRNGITRYVPMYATLESALAELSADGLHRYRRRSRASLPSQRSSIRTCRELTTEWLTEWARTDFIHVAWSRGTVGPGATTPPRPATPSGPSSARKIASEPNSHRAFIYWRRRRPAPSPTTRFPAHWSAPVRLVPDGVTEGYE